MAGITCRVDSDVQFNNRKKEDRALRETDTDINEKENLVFINLVIINNCNKIKQIFTILIKYIFA